MNPQDDTQATPLNGNQLLGDSAQTPFTPSFHDYMRVMWALNTGFFREGKRIDIGNDDVLTFFRFTDVPFRFIAVSQKHNTLLNLSVFEIVFPER